MLGKRILVWITVVGQIAGDDHEIGSCLVHLRDRRAQQFLAVAATADVDVGQLRDQLDLSLIRSP